MKLGIKTSDERTVVCLMDSQGQLTERAWEAGRELSQQLLPTIETLLHDRQLSLGDVSGVVVYSGPGSYTGLRIGISVANALAYAYRLPIVGTTGENWLPDGIRALESSDAVMLPIVPNYGGQPHITAPKK